ncbi:hypothetical protein TNCT_554331 [Trichonephila clavata]|uniref:Uncharacterized protein n=1 Tax=Trichonephila clavata TaxID=2740835 RepID=A0A8X6J3V6_TRICU|nr:hypothetical protein TNCT_554331 [Trichonephila clavata]
MSSNGKTFERLHRRLRETGSFVSGMHDTRRTRSARTSEVEGNVLLELEEQPETSTQTVSSPPASQRPSTLSCATCALLESNRPSATYQFFTMVPPTTGCSTRLCRTHAIHR